MQDKISCLLFKTGKITKMMRYSAKSVVASKLREFITAASAIDVFTRWTTIAHGLVIVLGIIL